MKTLAARLTQELPNHCRQNGNFQPAGGEKIGKMGQKNTFFQKQTGEVIENKGSAKKTNRKSAKNEAEKLLKTLGCIKNEPKRT